MGLNYTLTIYYNTENLISNLSLSLNIYIYIHIYIYVCVCVCVCVVHVKAAISVCLLFNGISIFSGYLMPNLSFLKRICPKVNGIVRLKLELAYDDSAVQRL